MSVRTIRLITGMFLGLWVVVWMEKMLVAGFLAIILVFTAGCRDPIAYVRAPFIAVNEAPYSITLGVQTIAPITIAAGGRTGQFDVEIPIARNPAGMMGPSLIDKSAYVKVVVTDTNLHQTLSQECLAAPKQVTYIQYKYPRGGYPYIYCGRS